MPHRGMLESITLFILVMVTAFVILLVLPNILWVWQRFSQGPCKIDITKLIFNACPQAPVTLETVIKPEYFPLTSDHALFSLLAANDTSTGGLQIQELLALSAFHNSPTVSYGGQDYDVKSIVKEKLDYL